MNREPKEYSFSVSQVIHNYGTLHVVASSIKEAKDKLKDIKQSSVDWYTDDYTEQMENAKLKFDLDFIREIQWNFKKSLPYQQVPII